jgi:hypothetical protein
MIELEQIVKTYAEIIATQRQSSNENMPLKRPLQTVLKFTV